MNEIKEPRILSFMELLKWLIGYALPHKKTFAIVFLMMATYAASNVLRLGMVGLLFDGIVVPGDKRDSSFLTYFEKIAPVQYHLPVVEKQSYKADQLLVTNCKYEEGSYEHIAEGTSGERFELTLTDGHAEFSRSEFQSTHALNFDSIVLTFRQPVDEQQFEQFSGELRYPDEGAISASLVSIEVVQGNFDMVNFLIAFSILGAVLAIVIAGSNYGKMYLTQSIHVRIIAAIRRDVFAHLSRLSVDYFQEQRSGDLISRVTNDVGSIRMALRHLFGEVIQHPMAMVGYIAAAWLASPELTILLAPLLMLVIIPVLRAGRKVKKHGRGTMAKLGEVTEAMSQLLSGIRVVKAFGMEEPQAEEFKQRNDGFIKSNLKVVRAKAMGRSLSEGIYNLAAAFAMLLAGFLLIQKWIPLTFGEFAVFFGAISSMYQPLKALSRSYNTIQESRAAGERVFEILEQESSVIDAPGAKDLPPLREQIVFDHVSFSYANSNFKALSDVSLTVPRGSTIALVGRSGAGKSTMLDLLARFYEPTSGSISIDGKNIRDAKQHSLLEQIAIVGQDPFLFNTTIEDNIRFGDPSASQEQLEAAARAASVHTDIMEKEHGYQTMIGDRGMALSGGQRQRVTIARAILKNAPILILDEATSALDSESERKVQEALENLMEGRTTFVIAHRLSTIHDADRILVLDKGKIIESGNHQELLELDGHYARLSKLQEL